MNDLLDIFLKSTEKNQRKVDLPRKLFEKTIKDFISSFVFESQYLTREDKKKFFDSAIDILEKYTKYIPRDPEKYNMSDLEQYLIQPAREVLPKFIALSKRDAAMESFVEEGELARDILVGEASFTTSQ